MRHPLNAVLVSLALLSFAVGCKGDGGDSGGSTPGAPTVTDVTPFDGARDQLRTATVTVTFSKAMNVAQVTGNLRVEVALTSVAVPGTIAASGGDTVFTFTADTPPTPPLAVNTEYRVVVPAGVQAADGGQLASQFTSLFRTHNGFSVSAASPETAATGVATNARVSVRFNLPPSQATVTNASFIVSTTSNGADIGGSISFSTDGYSAIYTPPSGLFTASTQYFYRLVNATVQATDGTSLDPFAEASFTTGTAPDGTPPSVSTGTEVPGDLDTNEPVDRQVRVDFDEPIDPSSVSDSTFIVRQQGGAQILDGTFEFVNGNTELRWTAPALLMNSTIYEVEVVADGIRDVAGNGFDQDKVGPADAHLWSFTTDATPPQVSATTPADNATGVSVNTTVVITFSEGMLLSTLIAGNFQVTPAASFSVSVSSAADPNDRVTLTFASPLAASTTYTVTAAVDLQDAGGRFQLDGNADGSPGEAYSFSFTTAP